MRTNLVLLTLALLAAMVAGCSDRSGDARAAEVSDMVRVKVFDQDGKLVGPIEEHKVVKTDAEWKKLLTDDQYRISRGKDTERPFCGTLLDNHMDGVYTCVSCGLPLFASNSKFNSGTGWPSFFQPIATENVTTLTDSTLGMERTEILCTRCGGHLGHVFNDGPAPTGERFCVNSESLKFTKQADLKTLADPAAKTATTQPAKSASKVGDHLPAPAIDLPGGAGEKASAVFAGGCFWCVEGVFEEVKGVFDAESGYAGGTADSAHYEIVSSGMTGHAEAVRITYDPAKVTYGQLLQIFFATHDPTTPNQQGPDAGKQYRSAIFYANDDQKRVAEAYIKQLNDAHAFKRPIVTKLEPLEKFYPAEGYHQNYVKNNPTNPYIRAWALPKIEKLKAKFPDEVKDDAK